MKIKIKDKVYPFDGYLNSINSAQRLAEECYEQGRADAIDEFSKWLFEKNYITTDNWDMWHLDREDIVEEFLKEQKK